MRIYNDTRAAFYQWDLNQRLTAEDLAKGDEVHFVNAASPDALVVKAYAMPDGAIVADVPNVLLQAALPITAYRYITKGSAEFTREEVAFQVQRRKRPVDYIYTETQLHDLEHLEARLDEKTTVTVEGKPLVTFAVDAYVAERLAALINSAPGALDTLAELAAALGNDPHFATTVLERIGGKVDKDAAVDNSVYAKRNGSVTGVRFTYDGTSSSGGTIPLRDANGVIHTGPAVRDDDAVQLVQMTGALDERTGDIGAAIDEIIRLQRRFFYTNLLNLAAIAGDKGDEGDYYDEPYLEVTETAIKTFFAGERMYSCYFTTKARLKDMAPELVVGKTYTLSWEVTPANGASGHAGTFPDPYSYLAPAGVEPTDKMAKSVTFVLTEAMLEGPLTIYAADYVDQNGGDEDPDYGYSGTRTFTNIMIAEGDTVYPYKPYGGEGA